MLLARWSDLSNWGDALNPVLIKMVSGEDVRRVESPSSRFWRRRRHGQPVYVVIGSTLRYACDDEAVVWGAGFRGIDDPLRRKPARVCAVRGPLTRLKLLAAGVECPEVYGDPALLYPRFYRPSVRKEYRLGIIPHFVDRDEPAVRRLGAQPGVRVIDIQGGINQVVDDICRCEKVASSSLHGMIAADAYGVPSAWIEFSRNVLGGGFKFYDYLLSVGRACRGPLVIGEDTAVADIEQAFGAPPPSIDLDKLWAACPFRKDA